MKEQAGKIIDFVKRKQNSARVYHLEANLS